MTNTKRIISFFLAVLMLFTLAQSVFAASDDEKSDETVSTFGFEDAEKISLTAAKSKMILEGLPNDVSTKAEVTKVTYDKENGGYKATVRSEYKYKYTCYISTNEILGKTIGFIAESEFNEQNVVIGFIGQFFERIAYFFVKKFN